MRVVGGRVLVAAFTTLCLLLIIGWSSGSVEVSYILRFYVTADNRQKQHNQPLYNAPSPSVTLQSTSIKLKTFLGRMAAVATDRA